MPPSGGAATSGYLRAGKIWGLIPEPDRYTGRGGMRRLRVQSQPSPRARELGRSTAKGAAVEVSMSLESDAMAVAAYAERVLPPGHCLCG
jgi:hypothetical protein